MRGGRIALSEIRGKNVVVTGGAGGMGRLVAAKMARLGATVCVYDVDPGALAEVVEQIEAGTGRRVHGFVCDVADRGAVYRAAEEVRRTAGPVDILVNNAGVVSGRRLMEIPDEEIERLMAVNVLSLFWVTKSFLPGMIERGAGHVVTMASAAGLLGVSKQTDYSASKHAAVGFAESLRVELKKAGHAGIRTTLVEPFYVDTGMFAGTNTRFPRVLPILDPERVTDRIVRAVRRDKQELKMPLMINLVPGLHMLPVELFDWLMDFFGVNDSMEGFVGRRGRGIHPRRGDGKIAEG